MSLSERPGTPMTESDRHTVPAPDDAPLSAREALDLARAKLAQERDLNERELVLKERELALHRGQGWRERLSSPAVVAIVAGLIGYIGTLISSYQNRQLERDKQEATLILEAIKTAGTAEEKERQTAANLVFLADAGLITTIKAAQMEKLRVKAQGAGPSLPAPQGVDFKHSSSLTGDLQATLEAALRDYQVSLARIGYDAAQARERVTVRSTGPWARPEFSSTPSSRPARSFRARIPNWCVRRLRVGG